MTPTVDRLPNPRHGDPRDAPMLRWGILGPGRIAEKFVGALGYTTQKVTAAGSRNAERAREFAERHGIGHAHTSYEDLVSDPDVDVVYVATPPAFHVEHALLAIAAGKHVLVEKPFAVSSAGARAIVEHAERASVFAMEAMWTRYLPHTDVVRRLLEDGALGEVRLVAADFGSLVPYSASNSMFDASAGGGALLDRGVYPISWALFAMGLPVSAIVTGTLGRTGVDLEVELLLSGPHDERALLSASMISRTPSTASIAGTEGTIEVDAPYWSPSGLRLYGPSLTSTPIVWRDRSGIEGWDGMAYEASAFARFVAEGLRESPFHPFVETIATLQLIEDAHRQLGRIRDETN